MRETSTYPDEAVKHSSGTVPQEGSMLGMDNLLALESEDTDRTGKIHADLETRQGNQTGPMHCKRREQ